MQCPICQSTDFYSLSKITYLEAGKFLTNNKKKQFLISNIVKTIWGREFALFLKCKKCHFSFAEPFVAGNKEYYSLIYDKEVKYPAQKWEYQKTIGVLKNTSFTKKVSQRYLEIGAGDGAFLSLISPHYISKPDIVATEYSEHGLSKIRDKGFKCYPASIYDLKQKKDIKKFDIACMFQVIEHVDDIISFFDELNELLNKKAKIFIAVPNAEQRDFFDKQGIQYDIPPTHIGRYSKTTFEYICFKNNWILKDFKQEPMSYKRKAMKFYSDRYQRANFFIKIETIEYKFIKLLLRYLLSVFVILKYLKVFIKLRSSHLGTASWAYIEKQ